MDAHGDLVLPVNGDEVRFHRPVVYQMDGGERKPVAASYRVANNETHFQVGAYDHRKALIIDPVLSYLTYLGGGDADYIGNNGAQQTYGTFQGQGIAVDAQGSAYVAGTTYSVNFPTQAAYQAAGRQSAGRPTGFVTKLNPAGTAFVYSTFLGGTALDTIRAIAVDSAGSAYVVGRTQSADFPVTSAAFQTICAPYWTGTAKRTNCSAAADANSFVTKLSPDGASLVYSTFLGGANRGGGDGATAVAVDSKGQAYVTGVSGDYCHPGNAIAYFGNGNYTYEQPYYCFPTTTGAFVPGTDNDTGSGNVPYNGGTPATVAPKLENPAGYLTVFSADGSSLLYSTLLSHPIQGGGGFYGTEVALDATGNVYVAGSTSSGNLSTTTGAFQTTTGVVAGGQTPPLANLPESRGFVAKFGPVSASAPASLLYLTYLGGSTTNQSDLIGGIVADSAGNAYVSGATAEPDFPVTAGAYQTACNTDVSNHPTNCSASFVTKIKPDGSGLVWSTYLGSLTSGVQVSFGGPIALDAKGNIYVVGTSNNAFPQVNPIQTNNGGNSQAFLAELDPTGSNLLFSTLVGSGGAVGSQESSGLALDPTGNIYVAGYTNTASSLPVTSGAAQGAYGGGGADGFIAKIVRFATAATTLSVNSASVVSGTPVTLTAVVAGPSGSSVPTGTVNFKNAGTAVGSATLNGTGTATTSVTLATGSNVLTAVYSGDNTFATSTSAPQTVTVTAPVPTVTISVSPSSIVLGAGASLTWSSSNATACTASGGWTGSEATSGTASVTPTAAGTLSLHADLYRRRRIGEWYRQPHRHRAARTDRSHCGQPDRHHRRSKHGNHLVLDRCHHLRRQRQLERSKGHQRHFECHPHRGRNRDLHVGLHGARRHGQQVGGPDCQCGQPSRWGSDESARPAGSCASHGDSGPAAAASRLIDFATVARAGRRWPALLRADPTLRQFRFCVQYWGALCTKLVRGVAVGACEPFCHSAALRRPGPRIYVN